MDRKHDTLLLYQALRPEDAAMTEEQIQFVTWEHLLLIQTDNDLSTVFSRLPGKRLYELKL